MYTLERAIDVHVHVAREAGLGFNRSGEQANIHGGRVRYADGTEAAVLPGGRESFPPEALMAVLEEHQVEKAIMLQGPALGFCNEYTCQAQQKYPGRLFGFGIFDPYAEYAGAIMRRQHEEQNFLGYKFEMSCGYGLLGFHPKLHVLDDIMLPVYEYCQQNDLVISFDMATFGLPSMQAEGLARLAAKYPGIRFVCEHCFMPGPGAEGPLREALALLKPWENVYVTTASIPNANRPDVYPFPKANRYIEIACDILGHKRVMWGTDIPQTMVSCSYRELKNHIRDSGLFSPEELQDIYYNNAQRFYFKQDIP